jgi:hypothetical protein
LIGRLRVRCRREQCQAGNRHDKLSAERFHLFTSHIERPELAC